VCRWGGRTEKDGPYIYMNDKGEVVRDEKPGRGGGHGPGCAFTLDAREKDHPIMKGLPAKMMHSGDELYHGLRGPAKNVTILATSFSDPTKRGTGHHEPTLMTISYGKGRVFHTVLRIAELASLRWAGRSATSNRKRRELESGRSRSFPIHAALVAVLKRLPRTDAYVFHGPRGGRIKPDTVRRILVREVIEPLTQQFPTPEGERGFQDGRLHSFRHFFCSTCANNGVPERMVMDWLGHADSEIIRYYYHVHDDEARRRMNDLDFLGGAGGRSVGHHEEEPNEEDVEPPPSEKREAG